VTALPTSTARRPHDTLGRRPFGGTTVNPAPDLSAAHQYFAAHALEVMRTNQPPYNGLDAPLDAQPDSVRAAHATYTQLLGGDGDAFGAAFAYTMPAEHGGARMVYALTDSTPHAAELYADDGAFLAACVLYYGRVAWVDRTAARGAMAHPDTARALFPPVAELVWIEHTPDVCESAGGRFTVYPLGDAARPFLLGDGTTRLQHPCATMAEARALALQLHEAG
jgi:hypothetical protein